MSEESACWNVSMVFDLVGDAAVFAFVPVEEQRCGKGVANMFFQVLLNQRIEPVGSMGRY